MSQPVFLFDIDGVLVEPGGYRQATRATLEHFTRRMGFGELYPGEETIALFESQNITSEWDIVPLCLAAIFDAAQARLPDLRLPADIYQACEMLRAASAPEPQVDTATLALRLGASFHIGKTFADLALELNRPGAPEPPFPHLSGHALLGTLLAESRDVRKSLTTRVFQHFVLGCQAFRETFGLPCEMESPSYLRLYDRPLLDPGLREEVLRRWQGSRLDLAAYTARPCRLRGEAGAPILPYSPEADVVLDACGLESLPLVGYGQVYRLAELTGSTSDHFVKPSVVQALGAIGAAVWREEMPAMLAAERWINHHEDGRFTGLPGLEIFIFEDSAGSVRAVQHAAELLQSIGVAAQVRSFGVARSPAKVAALRAAGAQIFMDVNQAVAEALKLVQS